MADFDDDLDPVIQQVLAYFDTVFFLQIGNHCLDNISCKTDTDSSS